MVMPVTLAVWLVVPCLSGDRVGSRVAVATCTGPARLLEERAKLSMHTPASASCLTQDRGGPILMGGIGPRGTAPALRKQGHAPRWRWLHPSSSWLPSGGMAGHSVLVTVLGSERLLKWTKQSC